MHAHKKCISMPLFINVTTIPQEKKVLILVIRKIVHVMQFNRKYLKKKSLFSYSYD